MLGFVLALAGCAAPDHKPAGQPILKTAVSVRYIAPRDDLNKRFPNYERSRNKGTDIIKAGETSTYTTGLNNAVVCESETVCRHAITIDELDYKTVRVSADQIQISGTVRSRIGRHLVFDMGRETAKFHYERDIGEGVPVIAETSTARHFEQNLKLGEQFEVPGLVDAKFVFTLAESEFY
jgi:hypothetical protein